MSKTTKQQRRIVNELNAVIHSRNLYAGPSRFINAHVSKGEVCLENLHNGNVTPLAALGFPLRTGSGAPVVIDWA